MKKKFTIKEVAKMLGLTIDAVRFYEKKGLVHPQINPRNQYREYTDLNILELLDIIYYRNLGLSITEIDTILKNGRKEDVKSLLHRKRIECEQRMRYEKQLWKKLSYLEHMNASIEQEGCCLMRFFPDSIILSYASDKKQDVIEKIVQMSKEEFVLSSLYYVYSLEHRCYERTMFMLEEEILKELQIPVDDSLQFVRNLGECVYMTVRMEGGMVSNTHWNQILTYAKLHQLTLSKEAYVREIPLTSYMDEQNYYAEIYVPVNRTENKIDTESFEERENKER